MKEKKNNQLDTLIKDVMKQSALETPSFNFTANVMQQIAADSKNTATVYKPLISKTGWVVMFIGVLAIIVYILLSGDSQSNGWIDSIDFSVLSNIKIPNLFSGIQFSHTTMYALLFFGIMVCVQIPFLKNYFNKRMSL
ncbi:hypothetical protein [Formosa maritima]|uniref:Uncharacterized protein n=1 Tax=Formosa maritima TaxID=2592046 RepID=A0A5D0G7I9_9FLAO|nr:hypothetical protein [Formosa maritima]TYA54794.1 hypothetical protein FVF61_08465 [Formosa maritima]